MFDWFLLLWILGKVLIHVCSTTTSYKRTAILVLSSIALITHVAAIFLTLRDREHTMYARDNILAFVLLLLVIEILDFLSLHEMFGPFSIMIQALMMDLMRFLVILFLFMAGFTLHVAVILKPVYKKSMVRFPEKALTHYAGKKTFWMIFENLFYACFGLTNQPKFSDYEEPLYTDTNPLATYYLHTFVFALYEIIAIIVLVNLLIAMMGNTYSRLDERASIEWKFVRAQIIRNMTKKDSVPVPANIVMTLVLICRAIKKTRCCCCKSKFVHEEEEESYFEKEVEDNDDDSMAGGEKQSYTVVTIEKAVNWKQISYEYLESKGIFIADGYDAGKGDDDDDDDEVFVAYSA